MLACRQKKPLPGRLPTRLDQKSQNERKKYFIRKKEKCNIFIGSFKLQIIWDETF